MGAIDHERDRRLFEWLSDVARQGRPCPTNEAICGFMEFGSTAGASKAIMRLESMGLITVERSNMGRVVTIVTTGKRTAGDIKNPRPQGDYMGGRIYQTRAAQDARAVAGLEAKGVDPPRVHRDPCPRCGVRGDAGCGHRASKLLTSLPSRIF